MSGRAPRVLVSGTVLGQPLGGVVRHNAELLPRVAARLVAAGGGLAVLEGRVPIQFALPPEVELVRSGVPWLPTWHRALHEGRAIAAAIAAARRAGRPYDLLHFGHHPVPLRLALPYTLTVHDLRTLAPAAGAISAANRVRRALAPYVLRRGVLGARRIFAVSAATRDALTAAAARSLAGPERRPLPPIDLVPNGIDHFVPLPRRPATPAYLLHVGHVEPRKGLEVALEALAFDPGLPRLVLAGLAKADEGQRLAAHAAALGVGSRLELRGAVDDAELRGLYAGAAAVVATSRVEGFGITALEALAAGVPLAATSIAAHLEVAGPCAEWFAPGDARECAAAVRRALGHGAAEETRGRARAAEWSWDTGAERWFAGLVAAARTEP
jgi:glycosyltransferase involved in cell wall biosynthesis